MKCLEIDRARRDEAANGGAMDIHRHVGSQPVRARPPGRLYELQKMVRRHKFGFAAAAAKQDPESVTFANTLGGGPI
jgi:eukaryotic-like serine/threonine-protein kinase